MWRRKGEGESSPRRQVLVIGLGRFGLAVAAELTRRGHEVLGVDVDPKAVEGAADVCAQVLELDGNDEDALRQLGVGDFDAAVVAIKDPARAILAAFILRDLGVGSIVARAQTPADVRVLERVGGTRPVLVEEAMGRYVARALGIRDALQALPVTDDVAIVLLRYPDAQPEREVAELEGAHAGITVLAVRREDTVIAVPGPAELVRPGDDLVIIGRQGDLESLRISSG
jgi:trk system potassium uptake protein TrkA